MYRQGPYSKTYDYRLLDYYNSCGTSNQLQICASYRSIIFLLFLITYIDNSLMPQFFIHLVGALSSALVFLDKTHHLLWIISISQKHLIIFSIITAPCERAPVKYFHHTYSFSVSKEVLVNLQARIGLINFISGWRVSLKFSSEWHSNCYMCTRTLCSWSRYDIDCFTVGRQTEMVKWQCEDSVCVDTNTSADITIVDVMQHTHATRGTSFRRFRRLTIG